MSDKDMERFLAKIKESTVIRESVGTPCVEWVASGNRFGHGQFWFEGTFIGSHRFAWISKNGRIPDGMCVCHRCDNPKCVRVDHLFLGTASDNRYDCIVKGRHAYGDRHGMRLHPERAAVGDRNGSRTHPESLPRGEFHWTRKMPERIARGERSGQAKISAQDVHEVFRLHRLGMSTAAVARKFTVSESLIRFVLQRKTWKHVEV